MLDSAADEKQGVPNGSVHHLNLKWILSDATRYLAAAAYTDKVFRNKAIEIEEAEFQARAPELGIDANVVLEHCYIARRRLRGATARFASCSSYSPLRASSVTTLTIFL